MTQQEALLETAKSVLYPNYKPQPLVLVRGEGRRVTDVDGRTYLDFIGGIAVTAVGHAHPRLARAIYEQASTLITVSNLAYNLRAIELAAQLVERTGFARAFFCNSGAEANEAMLKLARHHFHMRGEPRRTTYVATHNSFHGRTMGALSVTGQPKYHQGMTPLIPGVRFVDYGDVAQLEAALDDTVCAFIVEPIQAEGGVHVATDAYLQAARAACDRAGALLFFDEVQTGYGRTGTFLAREHSGVRPDACSLAKAIASGVPLGAMLVTEPLVGSLPPGTHGTTYGGNALACAAALEVLRIFDDEGLVQNAAVRGEALAEALRARVARYPSVVSAVRGRGLLQGLVCAPGVDASALVAACFARGLLLTVVGGNVIRFVPALNVTEAEVDEALAILDAVLSAAASAAA